MTISSPFGSSISVENTSRVAVVDAASMEVGHTTSAELEKVTFDIAFRIDCKRIPARNAVVGHQIMLLVDDVDSQVADAGIKVNTVVDLGIIKFTDNSPDVDEDVVARVEDRKELWAQIISLRHIWDALISEINRYEDISISPPHVKERRPLQVAIGGLKYFNDFSSPSIKKLPHIYCSQMKTTKPDEKSTLVDNQPALFI